MQIEEKLGAAGCGVEAYIIGSTAFLVVLQYPVVGEDITLLSFLYPLEYLLGL
jgi:hypothetical protein